MMKKTIATALSFVMLFINTSFVLAEGLNKDTDVKSEYTFSLNQAVEYALKFSPQIALSESKINQAKAKLSEDQYNYERQRDKAQPSFLAFMEAKGISYFSSKMALFLNEKSKEQAIETIKFSVINNYFSLVNASDKIAVCENNLKLADENFKSIKAKNSLGVASDIDLIPFDIAFENANLELSNAKRDFEKALMDFNKSLGLPLSTNINLTDKLSIDKPSQINIDEKVKSAQSSRLEILSANERLNFSKQAFLITSYWYAQNTFKYKQADSDVLVNQNALENAKVSVDISVRKAYLDMQGSFDALAVMDKSVKQLETYYNITKKKYDLGLATVLEVSDSFNKLSDIKLKREKAVLYYNLSKIQLEALCTIGLATASNMTQ